MYAYIDNANVSKLDITVPTTTSTPRLEWVFNVQKNISWTYNGKTSSVSLLIEEPFWMDHMLMNDYSYGYTVGASFLYTQTQFSSNDNWAVLPFSIPCADMAEHFAQNIRLTLIYQFNDSLTDAQRMEVWDNFFATRMPSIVTVSGFNVTLDPPENDIEGLPNPWYWNDDSLKVSIRLLYPTFNSNVNTYQENTVLVSGNL